MVRHRQTPTKMTEIFVSCDPASLAPGADSCEGKSGASGEVTELSAANSPFIDFSKLGLGRAGGARWPCAVYTACQECSCSTTIFACCFRRGHGREGRQPPRSTGLKPARLPQGCIWPQMPGFSRRAGGTCVPWSQGVSRVWVGAPR